MNLLQRSSAVPARWPAWSPTRRRTLALVKPARTPSTATTRPTAPCRWQGAAARSRATSPTRSSPARPSATCSSRPRSPGPGSSTCGSSPTGSRRSCERWRADERLGVAERREAADVRHRLQLAERRQAAARRPPAQHDHRRRPDPAAALPGPHGHHRQPPRRLGHAVRHAALRLQELPRRRRLSRPTRSASWPGCTCTSAD